VPRSRRAAPQPEGGVTPIDLQTAFERFEDNRRRAKDATAAAAAIKDEELMPGLAQIGVPHGDRGQHRTFVLDPPVGEFVRVTRQTSQGQPTLNIARAEKLMAELGIARETRTTTLRLAVKGSAASVRKIRQALEAAGIDPGIIEVEERFDQERMMAYHQKNRDKLTESQIDSLLDTPDPSYSLVPGKA
jgi:hypothetical protein